MLKNLGLDEFCCDFAPYYPDLVRVFYSNLKLSENGTMKTEATEKDLLITWIIMTTKQINWTHLIRHRMKKALRPGAPLPYPTLVTRILEHFEVPLEDEIFVPPTRHWTISGGVIQSFGLTQNADNIWVHRNSPPPPQPQNQPPPQLQLPPVRQQQTSRFDDVMRGINDLRTFVGASFNTLNE
ncbi:hypothetical protein LR48_Vigan538s000800 [Vigna angularis]|uniref:Uncharacterized protein n=1 Tax=Phaseolus angularis TaxID=3914 RepID=A0A0L9TCM5_PHAAN|nr:hypothetical protein LR48_Vigan538s000800 [Vigna angularis]